MKKKLLLLSCCIAAAFTVQAQDYSATSSPEKTYKPTAGDITTEIGFNIQNGTFFNGGQIRLRKFNTEDKAIRIGVWADYNHNKLGEDAYQNSFGVSIAPGIEKHFTGTNRLSPYIGAELPLGYRGSKEENENFVTEGGWGTGPYSGNRANFNVGLNGFAGVDYYFAPRFYVGFELGAGIQYRKNKDMVTTYKHDTSHTEESKGYHAISFSPFTSGGIRLGFVF